MIDIQERKIIIHRGDEGSFVYNIEISNTELYKFKKGDRVEFTIFEKKGYNKTPVLNKVIEIENETTEVKITLKKGDTTIGDPVNKPLIYWYEISLNGVDTTNGYDYEEGAAEFIVLPAKGGE